MKINQKSISRKNCDLLTNDNVNSTVELVHVLTNRGTTNTSVTLGPHVVSQGHDDLLDLLGQFTGWCQNQSLAAVQLGVNLLQDGNGKSGGLSCSGLGLSDDVMAFNAGDDRTLLNGRRFFETIGVDTTKEFLPQVHVIEVFANFVPIGIDETVGFHAGGAVIASSPFIPFATGCRTVGFPLLVGRGSVKKNIEKLREIEVIFENVVGCKCTYKIRFCIILVL